MLNEQGTHKHWLRTCPCGDGNFKIHLAEASETDIEEILAELPENGNKTKIAVLNRELKRRRKCQLKTH
jgi:hypothetical protein